MDELEKTAQETAEETGGMAPDAGEQQAPAGEQGVPGGGEDFEPLLRGRYKGEIEARVLRIVDGRLRGLRQENERLRQMAAAAEAARQREQEAQLQAAMEFAVIRARQQMAQAIASGGRRVAENGGRRRSVSRWDPRGHSGAELAAKRKRVQDGEKLRIKQGRENMEMNLQMFAEITQTTAGLSAEMKTYYGMELLENAKQQLVHNQFAATKGLPAGGGKTVEWRKFGAFDKALKHLTEGETPDGSGISVSYITKELAQYGDYTTVSDMLDLTAIDDVVLEITDRHGSNMGLTLDTVTRNEIQQGKQVIYAPKIGSDGTKTDVTSRMTLDKDCRMTSELVAKAATQLKKMNAPTFDGKYVCIIHPSVAFDLRQDEAWIAAHQYAGATELFSGEIGELHGVRFVETTEAKIYRGEDLAADSRTLKVNGNVMASTDVTFNGGTVAAGALAGRYVVLGGTRCQVVSNTDAKLVLDKTVTVGDKEVIYPGEGGKQGCAVYGCLFLGKGAYGVVDLSEGTEVIVKPRGSSGTADPLDQRSSVGWKGVHAAAILYDEYMVRVECGSSYSDEDKAN